MGSAASADVAVSATRIQWMWISSENPFSTSEPIEWVPYSDIENMIIEKAFTAGKSYAMLDGYHIDFKHSVQVSNSDGSKQRPVKRMVQNRSDHQVREERFTYTLISPTRPFAGLYGWISPFIRAVVKDLKITQEQLPSKDKTTVPMIVEKAALGILEEGKNVGKPVQAEELANILMEKKNAEIKEVWKCCARLYSLESFLYKILNETMRLIGSEEHEEIWRNRVRTLGPFCLLLWDNPFGDKTTERGTLLYRGATLSEQQISAFKDDCSKVSKPSRSFPSFTSCSRNRAKAEPFGNVLFIMTVNHAFSVDLEPFSEYPNEEEELLSPGVCFTVDRVEFNEEKKKHEIYLSLVQQYRREYTHSFYIRFCIFINSTHFLHLYSPSVKTFKTVSKFSDS